MAVRSGNGRDRRRTTQATPTLSQAGPEVGIKSSASLVKTTIRVGQEGNRHLKKEGRKKREDGGLGQGIIVIMPKCE